MKEKQNISMKEILSKRSFEPITNCNCKIESRIDYKAYWEHLCKVAEEEFDAINIDRSKDVPTITIPIDTYVGLKRTERLFDPAPWCIVGICEGLCKECRTTCPASDIVIERDKTAREYKTSMILVIQEMVKYLELTEEQAKILYHHNNDIAKQFMSEDKIKNCGGKISD